VREASPAQLGELKARKQQRLKENKNTGNAQTESV